MASKICDFSKEVTALGKAAFYSQMSLEKRAAYRSVLFDDKDSDDNDDDDGDDDGFDENCDEDGWHSTLR